MSPARPPEGANSLLERQGQGPKGAAIHDWIEICRLQDIPVLGARRVARGRGAEVAVFRCADDQVFALLDRCPHKGGPLSQGIVAGHGVTCPLHSWTITLADGQARAPDVGCAARFTVRVEDGIVSLCAQELRTRAVDGGAAAQDQDATRTTAAAGAD